MKTALPASRISISRSQKSAAPAGSRPEVGSSMTTTGASFTRTAAMPRRWRIPLE